MAAAPEHLVTTGFNILSLAVDPTNSSTIYAGTATHSGKGLLKSIDGGNTWTPSGLANDSVAVLAIDKTNTAKIYAGDADTATDAFVSVLDPSGGNLTTSSFFGGTGTDFGQGIAVDATGNGYITGFGLSTDILKQAGSTASKPALGQNSDNDKAIGPATVPADGSIQASEAPDWFIAVLLSLGGSNCRISLEPNFHIGIVGQPYMGSFVATNGEPPYQWPSGSTDVAGLNFDNFGGFQGTPMTRAEVRRSSSYR